MRAYPSANKLVSVIIPCFNAEQWLREAIDSVLKQTYMPIEIIVIDDGSSDRSLDIIKSYGDQIVWETGPNRGGNHARNRGFTFAKGDYIQYLDADDYLRPDKIQYQVNHLKATGTDVVYGDWQHQHHHSNGTITLDEVSISGKQPDILYSLLAGWWVSPACILFHRSVVEATGGWDESLTAGQDKDFFLAAVMSGAAIAYQPGCYSIYRRHGNATVSTASEERCVSNHLKILDKYRHKLASAGKLTPLYKDAIAQSLFIIARRYISTDRHRYQKYLKEAIALSPQFRPQSSERTFTYSALTKVVGFYNAERIALLLKAFRQRAEG